jgi:hypothetical protein
MTGQEAGLAGQVSARSEWPKAYWALRFGLGFDEATPDNLIEVDADQNTIQPVSPRRGIAPKTPCLRSPVPPRLQSWRSMRSGIRACSDGSADRLSLGIAVGSRPAKGQSSLLKESASAAGGSRLCLQRLSALSEPLPRARRIWKVTHVRLSREIFASNCMKVDSAMTPESKKSESASIAEAFEAVSKEIGMKAWPELCSMSRFLLSAMPCISCPIMSITIVIKLHTLKSMRKL